MDLSTYDRRKFELAEMLRALATLRPKAEGARDEAVQALSTKLAEDRFNLVVIGRFSRGKSSLMNAIIGLDQLPTGIAPLTSVITSVSYGDEAAVELTFEGQLLRRKIPLEELAQYVTQEGNPGNTKRVKLAEVQLPAEILRRGFYFIDTPGLGSAIAENTETTEAFLPAADAFLLVTSHDSPLSADELRILSETALSGRQTFIVLNKQDLVRRTIGSARSTMSPSRLAACSRPIGRRSFPPLRPSAWPPSSAATPSRSRPAGWRRWRRRSSASSSTKRAGPS